MNDENKSAQSASGRSWGDLGPRLGSAAVLIAVTLGCVVAGGWFFSGFVAVLFAGLFREWETMVTRSQMRPRAYLYLTLIALAAVLYPLLGWLGTFGLMAATALIAAATDGKYRWWRLAGLAFLCVFMLALLMLRGSTGAGILVAVYVLSVVWVTDSAAFFTGRQIGGEKLAPGISPSKTWSGALGGLALGTIAGTVAWFFLAEGPLWLGALFSAIISVLGQGGDLAESAIKRHFKIKDSGDIIPGHGGLMDRLDSLTLGAIFVAIVGLIHGGTASIPHGFLYW
ncbi:phosphatidate cytidylyltransferase [Devosia pacifica]|uniref:Phosphatidate cytidylyltransferase n=1 Tax=Devosia pacifica TaxID=1335967 RepID=A0A918RTM3_9HYPH|nr:phosphatidate cytidylyltransferase [Devosia pacifica]GHA10673.1 phosphatidate cytidylyltransferase [Devosia pacifica]